MANGKAELTLQQLQRTLQSLLDSSYMDPSSRDLLVISRIAAAIGEAERVETAAERVERAASGFVDGQAGDAGDPYDILQYNSVSEVSLTIKLDPAFGFFDQKDSPRWFDTREEAEAALAAGLAKAREKEGE